MTKLQKTILTPLVLLLVLSAFSENINPDYNRIFSQNEITLIEIEMDESDKNDLIYPADLYLNKYYEATIHIKNSKIDTTISPVGVRLRGNTSRGANKKSFKVDFKEYGGGQVDKLKKLNLKPNVNDLSMIREPLSWQFYREMDVPAARTAYVRLYMNDEYMGLYQNVEHIDDEFVDRRYGNEEGNLYKCAWSANLSADANIYNDEVYELKTNELVNDRSKLQEFIDVLNSADDGNWENRMLAVFDVDNYIRQMAVEAFIGHWDGYSFNNNNYYLYENPETGLIHFIPYDLDNTWGIDWIGPDWGTEDLMSWYTDWYDVPLTTRILESDAFWTKFVLRLNEVIDIAYGMEMNADILHDLIKNEVPNDPYYGIDFGYGIDDFKNSLTDSWGNHVEYGVVDYLFTRIDNAVSQVPVVDNVPELIHTNEISLYPNPCIEWLTIVTDIDVDQVSIYNVSGQLEGRFKLLNRQLDVGSLKPGLYSVSFHSAKGVIYNWFIKQ